MKKTHIALIAFIVAILTLSGCYSKDDEPFVIGKWNGNVFTNEWSDMRITLPETATRATSQEIIDMIDGDYDADANLTDIAGNEDHDYTKLVSCYDCHITLSDGKSALSLTYVNMDMSLGKFTPDEYLKSVYNQLKKSQIIHYTFVDMKHETIGGYSYTVAIYTVNDEMTQKYYCRKLGSRMVVMITSTLNGMESEMNTLLSMIEKANDK